METKLTKDEFVRRTSDWMLHGDDAEFAREATKCNTLDGLYGGRSRRIHRLIALAYHRGVRRGASLAWQGMQMVTIRSGDERKAP